MDDAKSPQQKRGRQPRRTPEQRREEILKAAIEVFGAKGPSDATMAEIGERVGMTNAGVHHYFGSKDNLLLEAVRHRDGADVAQFQDGHMPSGRAQFDHLIDTAFRNAKRAGIVQAFIVLSAEAITDDSPTRKYFEDRYVVLRKEIEDNFRRLCKEAGIEDHGQVARATASIVALMDGLQYQWTLDPSQIDLGETTAFGVNAIVDAVLSPEASRPSEDSR